MKYKLLVFLTITFLTFASLTNSAGAAMGGKKGKIAPCITMGNLKAQNAILKSRIKQAYCISEDPSVDPKLMFVISSSPLTWEGARLTAIQIGGQLTGIRSITEQNYVNLMNSLPGYDFYWIGGYDLPNDGTWSWQDTGQVFATGFFGSLTNPIINTPGAYTNWLYGEPNNPGYEQCLHGWNSPDGVWNNIPCDAVFNRFVMRLN